MLQGNQPNNARRAPSLPEHWENYLVCIVLHLLLPLMPLCLEFFANGKIEPSNLSLGASMYGISIGLSSKSKSQFGAGIILCFFFGVIYGSCVKTGTTPPDVTGWAYAAVFFTFLFHVFERYNRHVVGRQPFFEF